MIGDTRLSYAVLSEGLAPHHPDLATACDDAVAALDEYVAWIEESKPRMLAPPGVGRENYDFLMKEVYLFPYTWEEIKLIVELEDNRVCSFQRCAPSPGPLALSVPRGKRRSPGAFAC